MKTIGNEQHLTSRLWHFNKGLSFSSIGLGEKELMRTIKGVVIEVEIEVLVDTERGSQDLNSSTTSQNLFQVSWRGRLAARYPK